MKVVTLKEFAIQNRLKRSRNECGEFIIPGRTGQIYAYGNSRLGVMFQPKKHQPRQWGVYRTAAIAAGMTLSQDGDTEGCLVFNPENAPQVELAIKIAKAKRRRQLSEARRDALRGYLAKARNLPTVSPCSRGLEGVETLKMVPDDISTLL